jgi:hypothetical protein
MNEEDNFILDFLKNNYQKYKDMNIGLFFLEAENINDILKYIDSEFEKFQEN